MAVSLEERFRSDRPNFKQHHMKSPMFATSAAPRYAPEAIHAAAIKPEVIAMRGIRPVVGCFIYGSNVGVQPPRDGVGCDDLLGEQPGRLPTALESINVKLMVLIASIRLAAIRMRLRIMA